MLFRSVSQSRYHFWWYRLGRNFRRAGDELFFAIDGLEDTLAIYRRGVSYERLISNAQSAIRAGARVHWVMLAFKHNEDQINEARSRARNLGFSSFRLKATKRFKATSTGETTWSWPLEPSSAIEAPNDIRFRNPALMKNVAPDSAGSFINCHVAERKSLYLSAEGLVLPCCWIGSALYPADQAGSDREIAELLSTAGASCNIRRTSLPAIVESPLFQRELPRRWLEAPPTICSKSCNSASSAFKAQFIERSDFEILSVAYRSGR